MCPIYWYHKILSNLDRIIAIIILLSAIVFTIFALVKGHYSILPIVILLSSTTYLLFRGRVPFNEDFPIILESNRLAVLTHIIFFFSISFLLWLSWDNLYYNPPLYFVIILIAAGAVIINIFCLDYVKSFSLAAVFMKIIILSCIVYAGIYYQFDNIYGTDPWLHIRWIQETINISHLSDNPSFLEHYYLFPIFHLNGTITSIITNLSSYSSVFVSCGLLMAMSGVFTFIIARTMIHPKAALLVALIVPLSSYNIEKSTELLPMSLGYIFVLLIMCFLFCFVKKSSQIRSLIVFLSITLIFTHTIAALAMLLILIAFFIGIKTYSITRNNMSFEGFSPTYLCVFMVLMIMKWLQQPPGYPAFIDYRLSHLTHSLQMDSLFVLDQPTQISNISSAVLLFDQFGYLLLLTFAIIGALIYLHVRVSTPNRVCLLFITGSLFTMIYSFSLINLDNILPYRWYIFLYLPLSILAVTGLLWISNILKRNTRRIAIVMLLLLVMIFCMTTNSIGNKDSPFFFNNAVRYGYTQSEFAAIHTLSNAKAGIFVTDLYFSTIFSSVLTDDEYNEMTQSNKKIFIQRNYYLENPEWDNEYKISIVEGKTSNIIANNVLILNFMEEEYRINNLPIIYSNGNIKVYVL